MLDSAPIGLRKASIPESGSVRSSSSAAMTSPRARARSTSARSGERRPDVDPAIGDGEAQERHHRGCAKSRPEIDGDRRAACAYERDPIPVRAPRVDLDRSQMHAQGDRRRRPAAQARAKRPDRDGRSRRAGVVRCAAPARCRRCGRRGARVRRRRGRRRRRRGGARRDDAAAAGDGRDRDRRARRDRGDPPRAVRRRRRRARSACRCGSPPRSDLADLELALALVAGTHVVIAVTGGLDVAGVSRCSTGSSRSR